MDRSAKVRVAVGVVVVAVLIVAVTSGVQQSRQLLIANDICNARDVVWSDIDSMTSVEAKKVAVECACTRVTAAEVGACVERLVPLVSELSTWDLNVDVARVAAAYLTDEGRWPLARQFVEAGLRQEPGNVALNALWLGVVRDRPERELLQEVKQRARSAGEGRSALLRLVATNAYRLGDFQACIEATAAPSADVDYLVVRSYCLAAAGQRDEVLRLWAAWKATPQANPALADSYQTAILFAEHAATPADFERLRELELKLEPGDIPLQLHQWMLYILVSYASSRPETKSYASEVVDRSKKKGVLSDAVLQASGGEKLGTGETVVEFHVAPPDGGTVLVSVPRVDAPFRPVSLVNGQARVVMATQEVPLRYVVRDASQGVIGSGSVAVRSAGQKHVQVVAAPPQQPRHTTFAVRPADGRRRIFVLIPDSWDWRLLNVLRARGEVPAVEAMIAAGVSGAVWSEPALTASAMTSLAHPDVDTSFGVVALLHEMGGELGGLASVGSNPLEVLSPWLPQRADLFATIGAGQHSIANLLFSHADIDAGRHAVRTGPNGQVTDVPVGRSVRPLNAAERALAPSANEHAGHFETTAAQLDLFAHLIDAGTDDVVLLRAEAVDLLTHARFHETANGKQDNATSSLYSMYRMIDLHLRDILARIDADDVFIVMSDHGALTNMQHDNHAVFIAVGLGQGQLEGEPHLRGLPRLLTDLLGVSTNFPDTGFSRVVPATGTAETASGP